MKKTVAFLISILLFVIPIASAHADYAVYSSPAIARAATSVSFSVSAASNNKDLAVYACLLSTVKESYMNLNVTLQQYVNSKWESYKFYNSYVKDTTYCVISEAENAPKGYYYRLALSFYSSSIPSSGLYYSDTYYW